MYKGWIYVIENLVNSKIYTGQTSQLLEDRFKQHKADSKKDHYNMLIYKAMNKYGIENFRIRPINYVTGNSKEELKKALDNSEIYYIALLKSKDKNIGYNLTDGGSGCTGRVLTESTKKKISDSKKGEKNPMYGTKWTDEKREKMKIMMTGENNHNFGKPLSDETKQKLRDKLKNREISKETRQKISESTKGIAKSEEMKKKLSESKKGKLLSEETKLKIKETRLTGANNPKSKKVGQYDCNDNLIKIFDSMSDAARECKTFHSSISACCNGGFQSITNKFLLVTENRRHQEFFSNVANGGFEFS